MRRTRDSYLNIIDRIQEKDGRVSVSKIARKAKRTYGAAYHIVRALGINCPSKEENTIARYQAAVFLARTQDKDGLVTFTTLRNMLKVEKQTIFVFFKKHPELIAAWCIRTEVAAKKERIRSAARRLRARCTHKPLLRKQLAFESDMTEKSLDEYLRRPKNKHLVDELGIAYTYPDYGSGKRRKKQY